MPVQLVGTSGLFTRFGQLISLVNVINTQRGSTLNTYVTNILNQYLTTQQDVIAPLTADEQTYRNTQDQFLTTLQNDMINTCISQVNSSIPLTQLTLSNALKALIAQMVAAGDTLQRPNVSVTVTPNSTNYGSTTWVATLKNPNGDTNYMPFCESIKSLLVNDVGTGGVAYQESVNFAGLPAVSPLSYLWQGSGSGCNATSNVNNAAGTSLILTNGNFDTWTSNIPDNWTVVSATPGTTLVRGVSPVRGTYNLSYVGNGSQLTSLYQVISGLTPNSVLGLSFFAKRSTSLAAGVLVIALTDGSGSVITDDAGGSCSTSITLSSGLTTSYASKTAIFVLPKVLPSTVQIRIYLTTAITNGETLDISLLGLFNTLSLYNGGPRVFTFSGATQGAIGDGATIAISSDISSSGFIPSLDRFFGLRNLSLAFPSASSPTISNSLITTPQT